MTDYQEVRTTEHEQGREQRVTTFQNYTNDLAPAGTSGSIDCITGFV